jgi:hypothetical protein
VYHAFGVCVMRLVCVSCVWCVCHVFGVCVMRLVCVSCKASLKMPIKGEYDLRGNVSILPVDPDAGHLNFVQKRETFDVGDDSSFL